MSDRKEGGGCFCGAIIAEVHGDPFWICYDHDTDCRRAIGSPVVVWVGYRPKQFSLVTGNPRAFSKTPGVVRTFCSNCGTSISYLDEALENELYIALGFFDRPENFHPEAHAYWGEKLSWIEFADRLPRIEAYSRRRDSALGTPKHRTAGNIIDEACGNKNM
jgi:hypothetical protein